MVEPAAPQPPTRTFMGASVSLRLGLAALCLAVLWSGVWWAIA